MKKLTYLFALLFLGSFAISCENEDNTADLYELNIEDELNGGNDDKDEDLGDPTP